MSFCRDEQTKLTATFLNTVAVAIIVAGTIAPLFSVLYGLATLTVDQIRFIALAAPTWFLIGIAIHSLARLVLRGLGRDG